MNTLILMVHNDFQAARSKLDEFVVVINALANNCQNYRAQQALIQAGIIADEQIGKRIGQAEKAEQLR